MLGRRIAVKAVKSNQEQRDKRDWGLLLPRMEGIGSRKGHWSSEASLSIADRSWAVWSSPNFSGCLSASCKMRKMLCSLTWNSSIISVFVIWFGGNFVARLVKNLLAMRETGFDPWVGKISWRREWPPTPVFWPGEVHGLYSSWGCKESDATERISLQLGGDRRQFCTRGSWPTDIFTSGKFQVTPSPGLRLALQQASDPAGSYSCPHSFIHSSTDEMHTHVSCLLPAKLFQDP